MQNSRYAVSTLAYCEKLLCKFCIENSSMQTAAVTPRGIRIPLLRMLIFVELNGMISESLGPARSRGVGGIAGTPSGGGAGGRLVMELYSRRSGDALAN